MAQEFLPNSDNSDRPNDGCAVAEQEILRVAVTGSRDGVLQTISTLHQLGFAKIGDWSRLQRGARPGEVVSVLIVRRRSRKVMAIPGE